MCHFSALRSVAAQWRDAESRALLGADDGSLSLWRLDSSECLARRRNALETLRKRGFSNVFHMFFICFESFPCWPWPGSCAAWAWSGPSTSIGCPHDVWPFVRGAEAKERAVSGAFDGCLKLWAPNLSLKDNDEKHFIFKQCHTHISIICIS